MRAWENDVYYHLAKQDEKLNSLDDHMSVQDAKLAELATLKTKFKMLYIHISTLSTLIVGDVVARYISSK